MLNWGWIFFITYFFYINLSSFIFWPLFIAIFVALWLWTSGGTLREKISIASYTPPREGAVHIKMEIDVTKTQQYIERIREETGERVTMTHLVGKSLGLAISRSSRGNSRIVLGRFVPRETVDIAFLVHVPDTNDLAFVTVRDVVNKPMPEVSKELNKNSNTIRQKKDKDFNSTLQVTKLLPTFLLHLVGSFGAFLSNCLGVSVPQLGLKPHSFGSGYVTSLGMYGIEEAYAPITHITHAGFLMLVGAIVDKPVVINGEIHIRPMMTVTGTADHRYVDGAEAGKISQSVKAWLADPDTMEQ
jgi:pyruvate dehydrogenase E2 component (dihydrolipoamide acetyltransferase)